MQLPKDLRPKSKRLSQKREKKISFLQIHSSNNLQAPGDLLPRRLLSLMIKRYSPFSWKKSQSLSRRKSQVLLVYWILWLLLLSPPLKRSQLNSQPGRRRRNYLPWWKIESKRLRWLSHQVLPALNLRNPSPNQNHLTKALLALNQDLARKGLLDSKQLLEPIQNQKKSSRRKKRRKKFQIHYSLEKIAKRRLDSVCFDLKGKQEVKSRLSFILRCKKRRTRAKRRKRKEKRRKLSHPGAAFFRWRRTSWKRGKRSDKW